MNLSCVFPVTDPEDLIDFDELSEILGGMSKTHPAPSNMWTTRDGRRIFISDMTDKHLVNVLLYLKRKIQALIEFSHRSRWRQFAHTASSRFSKLEAEAIKRGLTDWESRWPMRD